MRSLVFFLVFLTPQLGLADWEARHLPESPAISCCQMRPEYRGVRTSEHDHKMIGEPLPDICPDSYSAPCATAANSTEKGVCAAEIALMGDLLPLAYDDDGIDGDCEKESECMAKNPKAEHPLLCYGEDLSKHFTLDATTRLTGG